MAKSKKSKLVGKMTVLQIISYKDVPILIRRFPENMFVWDIFYKGEFYSSYIVMDPAKGRQSLTAREVAEVVKMCYAGAAASIDYQNGEKLSKTEEEIVNQFEAGRQVISGEA